MIKIVVATFYLLECGEMWIKNWSSNNIFITIGKKYMLNISVIYLYLFNGVKINFAYDNWYI